MAMDAVKMALMGVAVGMLRGVKDSICGTLAIFHLNRMQQSTVVDDPPLTELMLLSRRYAAVHAARPKRSHEDEPRVVSRIFQCCLLNGAVFWLSIAVFNSLFLPGLKTLLEAVFGSSDGAAQTVWSWMRPLLSFTFDALWVLPLFALSKIVNSLWFQDIADSAYRHTKGRPRLIPSLSKLIADTLFSILIQALFLLQGMLMSLLPIAALGQAAALLHMCLLYSLYSFEYKWFNMGWELHKRLSFIENNWPYFVGFGLPLAVLTAIPSSYIVSGCVFSILFPLFILSGNEAEPVVGTCECPLQLFSPVVCLSNAIFHQTMTVTSATPTFIKGHRVHSSPVS